ncbi:MAG: winged helix-turn-helix domain-containing protein [Candidatus Helarchaeota archaeon]
MGLKILEEYLKKIPLGSRNAIEALRNKKRQAIVMYLKEEGTKSFIDISNKFGFKKGVLSHHLKILVGYRIIYHFYSKKLADDKYSFYELSKLGERVITGFINLLKQNYSPTKHENEAESADDIMIGTHLSNKIPYDWGIPKKTPIKTMTVVPAITDATDSEFKGSMKQIMFS